jgi:zona occludens toxin (predicted ATPase)
MSIIIVSSIPGGGKTLGVLKRWVIPAVKKGRQVYTNIDGINLLGVSIYAGVPFEDVEKNLIAYELQSAAEIKACKPPVPFKFSTKRMKTDIPNNSLVVVDEAQVFWNNRDYASQENKDLLPFLQMHRHLGIDIVFITQNIDQLDIGIRRLAQIHYRLVKLDNMGLSKTVKVKLFPDAMGSEQFKPMSTEIWRIDSNIFGLYKSYAEADIVETKTRSGNVLLKNPKLIGLAVLLFVCLFFAIKSIGKTADMVSKKQGKEKDFSKFDLGDYDEYYCGDKFYVLRAGGKVDTLQPKDVPPSLCPHINFNFRRVVK